METRVNEQSSEWDTEVQKVNNVKSMARSKFFWLPLFCIISLYTLSSDIFFGFRDISFNNSFLVTTFDLNLFKIVVGIAFIFLPFIMLQGKGRRIGAWLFLLAAVLCPAVGTIPVIQNSVSLDFQFKYFYYLIFLSCWYVLMFYAPEKQAPIGKTIKVILWMFVFVFGIYNIMVLTVGLSNESLSFWGLLRANEFNLNLALGFASMLLSLTFLWKDILGSDGAAKVFSNILYWGSFLLPICVSIFMILAYVSFERKLSLPPDSWFTLEATILCACSWMLILFYSMYKYRIAQYNKDHLLSLAPINIWKRIFQVPLWFFVVSLLFSDMFYGFRNISIPRNTTNDILSWSVTFDLNLFKIVIGIALLSILIKLLRDKSRIIAGWVCLVMAFLCPVIGVFPVIYKSVDSELPVKMMYSLLFLTCWFVLTFYARMKDITTSKIIKAFLGLAVFIAGIFTFMVLNLYMSNQAISFAEIFRSNEFNLHFALGFAFILSAVTFLWKDISNGEGLSSFVGDILYWGLFAMPIFISFYSINGYVSFNRKASPPPESWLTLESTLLLACFWILVLFHNIYQYRIEQEKTGVKYFPFIITKSISSHSRDVIFKSPIWLFLIALLFSDIFYGFRNLSISGDTPDAFLSFAFDLNVFKIAVGISVIPILIGILRERGCRIGGWICLFLAFANPVMGTIPIIHNGIGFELPEKMLYTAMFLSYWFILTFYSHIKDYSSGKIIKTYLWMTVLMIGVCELMVLTTDMNNRSMSLAELIGGNTFNLNLLLGIVFVMAAIMFLWKDVSDGKGSAIFTCDVLFWAMFFTPIILSLCTIWGYSYFITKATLASASQVTTNWIVFTACLWMILLFRSMYKYRIEEHANKKDSYHYIAKIIPQKVLKNILILPIWIFVAAVPMFIIYNFFI